MTDSIKRKAADNIRILSAAMVEKAQSGHPGGAMGGADFMTVLYSEFLRFDPADPAWRNRDRFFLDPGHMSAMLYSTLSLYGFYSMEELSQFRQWESPTPGHPEVDIRRGVENTSGPLGQGHSYAVGAAIAEKFLQARFGKWMEHRIYAYISDGGVQEEISQGAGRLAGHLGLGNLIMFYDSNSIQLSSGTEAVTSEDTEAKYKAWGWQVLTVDGTNQEQIRQALKTAISETGKPSLIIGKTIMGQGCLTADGKNFEGQCSTHGQPLSHSGASFEKTIENLGGNPADPFVIFPEVSEWIHSVKETKHREAQERKEIEAQWRKENKTLSEKWDLFFSGKIPSIAFNEIQIKPDNATRATSGEVLSVLAQKVENMVISSADLSNSDKTDGFLKKTKAFARDDFSGAFLQAGVAELTMAAVMTGMALHGGIIPACGTFFVFSDYIKPVARVAALMELPVKFIWTHDAFRVGEDGPTHQPIEHEAQIRLMEKLKNHSGKNAMLVLRPADAAETVVAWEMALENTNTPTALILSRQNIKDLPAKPGSVRQKDAAEARKGAYIVQDVEGTPDLVFLASGSEVATMIAGAELLKTRKNLKIRVVSVISEGLFRNQTTAYQKQILPEGVPTLGFTAGLPVTLEGLVGLKGRVFGLGSFGFSAPAKVLDEKLGFTAENVVSEAEKLLSDFT